MVIRRIRWQRIFREAIAMGQHKRLHRGAGVITGALIDQKQVLHGLCHDPLLECLVTFRVKPAFDVLREQTPGELQLGQALGGVEMSRHKARLLKGKAQVREQLVEHPTLAPAQHPEYNRIPTGRLTAHDERTSVHKL
jgi:hypothetical protein